MIEREKVEEIKRQTDIVMLISQYLPLKKIGKNYRALCPFHAEKTPSFYVSQEKGIYYCFGCKKGGNAISFLMEYEKLDFPDAIKRLAKNLGIEIDTTKGLKYKEIYEVNELASQFYSLCLTKELGKRGQNYLKERKIDLEKLKDFRLGFAPASGGLIIYMRQKGVALDRLNKAGLISTNKEIFHDRFIFPIFNLSGRVIAFGGRSIDENMQPKYLNSPETPIFKKGEVLYGLYQNREAIRNRGKAIIVEGYFDLLSLVQGGINNVCAPLGTALTERQTMLLSRFARKVNILFDGDLSGIKAALRAIGLLIDAQVDVHVSTLPEDLDPDKYINKHGADDLQKLIEQAPDFFHFYRATVKTHTVEQEVSLIKDLIQIISSIQDPIRFERYLKYISHVYDIPMETIKRAMGQKPKDIEPKPLVKTKISQEERLIAMIFNSKEYLPFAKEILLPDDFSQGNIRRLYQSLLKDENLDIDDLAESGDEDLREKIYSVTLKEEPISKPAFLEALQRYKNGLAQKNLREFISQAKKSGDDQAITKYQEALGELKRKMLNLDVVRGDNGL